MSKTTYDSVPEFHQHSWNDPWILSCHWQYFLQSTPGEHKHRQYLKGYLEWGRLKYIQQALAIYQGHVPDQWHNILCSPIKDIHSECQQYSQLTEYKSVWIQKTPSFDPSPHKMQTTVNRIKLCQLLWMSNLFKHPLVSYTHDFWDEA
jgi:hypothetical protein